MRASSAPPRLRFSPEFKPAPRGSNVPAPPLPAASSPRQAPPRDKPRPSLQVGAIPVTPARHCPVSALLQRAPGWGALGPWEPALVPASSRYALHLQPGVVHGRGHGRADSGRVDVADDAERLFQCVVHAQHLVAPLRLLGRLLHQCVLVPARVQVGQQLREDEFLGLRAGKERKGLGPDACTNLPSPPGPTSSGMGLCHCLNSEISLASPPPRLPFFSDGPEKKSELFKVIDLGEHSGPIMHQDTWLLSLFQPQFPHL